LQKGWGALLNSHGSAFAVSRPVRRLGSASSHSAFGFAEGPFRLFPHGETVAGPPLRTWATFRVRETSGNAWSGRGSWFNDREENTIVWSARLHRLLLLV